MVGNTVTDAVRIVCSTEPRAVLPIEARNTVYVYLHRREGYMAQRMDAVWAAVAELAEWYSKVEFRALIHPNPLTRPNIPRGTRIVEVPLMSYPETIRAIQNSICWITDSGGNSR